MSGILKKAAVTLATALTTAAASAQGVSIWLSPSYHDRPQHGPRYDHYPRHPQHPPRHVETPTQKCNRAIFNQARLDAHFPRTGVGFIEGRTYACRINLNTGRLSSAYNLETQSGFNAYQNAKISAYNREYPRQHRPRHNW